MVATFYILIPFAFALLGGSIATLYTPKTKVIALMQHFVAGILLAAVSTELLPKILGVGSPLTIGIGFVLGVVLMFLLHECAHLLGQKNIPLRMVGASALDLFIDGLLMGLSFLAGTKSGILIALSLTPCAFFLNLTLSATLTKKRLSKSLQFFLILFVALMLPLGGLLGYSVIEFLPKSYMVETLAAGVAALLYLAIEEFLVEAHETKDTHFTSLSFFLGFLIVLIFSI